MPNPDQTSARITLHTERGRRTFAVRQTERGFLLTGTRGATYVTVPYRRDPSLLFLSSRTTVDPLGPLVLTVREGSLCQVQILNGCIVTEHGHPVIHPEGQE